MHCQSIREDIHKRARVSPPCACVNTRVFFFLTRLRAVFVLLCVCVYIILGSEEINFCFLARARGESFFRGRRTRFLRARADAPSWLLTIYKYPKLSAARRRFSFFLFFVGRRLM